MTGIAYFKTKYGLLDLLKTEFIKTKKIQSKINVVVENKEIEFKRMSEGQFTEFESLVELYNGKCKCFS
jgi:hypothetical protein